MSGSISHAFVVDRTAVALHASQPYYGHITALVAGPVWRTRMLWPNRRCNLLQLLAVLDENWVCYLAGRTHHGCRPLAAAARHGSRPRPRPLLLRSSTAPLLPHLHRLLRHQLRQLRRPVYTSRRVTAPHPASLFHRGSSGRRVRRRAEAAPPPNRQNYRQQLSHMKLPWGGTSAEAWPHSCKWFC